MRPLLPLIASLALLASDPSLSEGWPVADCATILSIGQPRPAWGSKEKITQEGLLLMINYQMTFSACQQDELLKALRQQQASKNQTPAAVPKPRMAEASELPKPPEKLASKPDDPPSRPDAVDSKMGADSTAAPPEPKRALPPAPEAKPK